jgi:hypothetical protein
MNADTTMCVFPWNVNLAQSTFYGPFYGTKKFGHTTFHHIIQVSR